MKTDDIDLKIIRRLWNGRTPYKDIGEEIGLTTNTVRSRVNRLLENGILQIIGLVDPDAIPNHSSAVAFFKIEHNKRKEALEQIGALKNVVTAASLNSCYDVIALIMLNDEYSHKNFMINELKKVEGVISVETAFPIDAVDWQLRYVL
ncbi:MAG: Lrp/AsnC family transcriptional regulator [Proteobacteria bacterium]|nr:Lrp/AsnC family transcriptional regulator [Pseudomonadota bacterium]